ncbi:MAG: RluA family pseudouridine synthase [Gammaproteobacteria bacterium]|nr:RluA family pseudouridine synthase [Gammaproteobacteria bacterium]
MKDKQAFANGDAHQGVRRLKVGEEFAGQRLDNFLARELKGVPRGHVYRLLRTGQVRVNGGRRRPKYRLADGDEVRLPPVRLPEREPSTGPLKRTEALLASGILFEDKVLLAVNKPPGMPVHGGSGLNGGLIEALRTLRKEPELELIHRLDRDTSGCLLIARRRSALRALHAALREGKVDKRYLALLVGRVDQPFVADAPLERYVKRGGERHVTVSREGKAAKTFFEPLASGERASLVLARPATGRTHQIRVHALEAGHPVAGDSRYGDKAANRQLRDLGLRRLGLHAASLCFEHPQTGENLSIEAPLPDDLAAAIHALTAGAENQTLRFIRSQGPGIPP